jgi:hypothetical protein
MFRRNVFLPSSLSKSKPVKKPEIIDGSDCLLLIAGFLLDLFFGLEDGGEMFLRNVGGLYQTHGVRTQISQLLAAKFCEFSSQRRMVFVHLKLRLICGLLSLKHGSLLTNCT